MFDSDFQDYMVVLDRLTVMVEEQPANLIQIADVIFKWIYLKLDEVANNTFTINVYDFLGVLFTVLISNNYLLSEAEFQMDFNEKLRETNIEKGVGLRVFTQK